MNLSYRNLFSVKVESNPKGAPNMRRKFLKSPNFMKVVAFGSNSAHTYLKRSLC